MVNSIDYKDAKTKRIYIEDAEEYLIRNQKKQSYDIIYIDPPYDTKTLLSYNDDRSDWESFIRRKLVLAYGVLAEDGIIYMSIDDNRVVELAAIADGVFGKKNRLAIMITHQAQRSNSKLVNVVHEYVLVYAKDKRKAHKMEVPKRYTEEAPDIEKFKIAVENVFNEKGMRAAEKEIVKQKKIYLNKYPQATWINNYRKVDENGQVIYPVDLSVPGMPNQIDINKYNIHLAPLPTRRWQSKERITELAKNNRIVFLEGRPYEKRTLDDACDPIPSIMPFYSRQGTEDLKRIGCSGLFDTPKPIKMIEYLIEAPLDGRKKLKILDFFAGSGTTMCAAYNVEQRRGVHISCDIVQISEPMREGSKPYTFMHNLELEANIEDALLYRLDRFLVLEGALEPGVSGDGRFYTLYRK